MELIIVERRFSAPARFEDLQETERAHGACLEAYGIVFLRSYFSRDRRRMLCLYQAPDAESVRKVNDVAGLPYEAVWAATVHTTDSETG